MTRLSIVAAVVLAGSTLAGCNVCTGPGQNGTMDIYTADEQLAGQVVAPASWNLQASIDPNVLAGGSGGDARLCASQAGVGPACDSIGMVLIVSSRDPASERRLTLQLQIKGPPPKTVVTLPSPDVSAWFDLAEANLFEEFPVTGGTLSTTVRKDNFVATIDATASTPDGAPIAIRDGRYAWVNGHTETICVSE